MYRITPFLVVKPPFPVPNPILKYERTKYNEFAGYMEEADYEFDLDDDSEELER